MQDWRTDRALLTDRLVGGFMMVGFFALALNSVRATNEVNELTGQDYSGGWLGYLALALTTAARIYYSFGVYEGRKWAFVVATLFSATYLAGFLTMLEARPFPVSIGSILPPAVHLITFAYCGLRIFGPFGMWLANLLPQRDEALYEDPEDEEPAAVRTDRS